MSRYIDTFYSAIHGELANFDDVRNASFPSAKEFRNWLNRDYPEGMHGLACLDAGCGGAAVNAYSLARLGAKVQAVDLNKASVDNARKELSDAIGQTITFQTGSLLALPFRDNYFDFIVCSGVAHHTPDPQQALCELYRVLKPGGKAYISVYCFKDSWLTTAVRVWRALSWIVPFRLMHEICKKNMTLNNFVLDHMYVPILYVYSRLGFLKLLETSQFVVTNDFCSAIDLFQNKSLIGRSLTGDGMLRVFICRK